MLGKEIQRTRSTVPTVNIYFSKLDQARLYHHAWKYRQFSTKTFLSPPFHPLYSTPPPKAAFSHRALLTPLPKG